MDLLCTAICHLAHFVDSLSVSLNIPLPHPLSPFELNGPTISPQYSENQHHNLLPVSLQILREEYRAFSWKALREIRVDTVNVDPMRCSISTNSYFPEALSLFQANVVTLCLRMGITPESLFPPCCIIKNLYLLRLYLENALSCKDTSKPIMHDHILLDYEVLESQFFPLHEDVIKSLAGRFQKQRAKPNSIEAMIDEADGRGSIKQTEGVEDGWDLVETD